MINAIRGPDRFARDLWRYLRRPVPSVDEAGAIVAERLGTRGERFLRMAEQTIYAHEDSPYLALLRHARCELGDLREMVRRDGLEPTLRALHAAGVYVTFEEFKGRQPIVRDELEVAVTGRSFDDPRAGPSFEMRSGGSTGPASTSLISIPFVEECSVDFVLGYEAHGLTRAPAVVYRYTLPGEGLGTVLRQVGSGNPVLHWFSPVMGASFTSTTRARLAVVLTVAMSRLAGAALPYPRSVEIGRSAIVARAIHDVVSRHSRCIVRVAVSVGARTALAAVNEGIDLTGATFDSGSEPPTSAKVGAIESSGARFVPSYIVSELGPVGMACAHGLDQTDVHFQSDALALITVPQTVPGTDVIVDAFCLTGLREAAPKVVLNVEFDDFGTIEQRSCGCLLGSAGFTTHLRGVRSYRKLTTGGVTLVGSDMERILEKVLPERFGGTPFDYQLVEAEEASGVARVLLVVSPRVGEIDEQAAVDEISKELGRIGRAERAAAGIWSNAGMIRVVRAEPMWTPAGKFLPIRTGALAGEPWPTGG